MSITEELRKWVKSLHTPNSGQVKDKALRIADRIDAAMEDYIELPKDADGMPIRIGDKMLLLNGRTAKVYAIGVGLSMVWNPDDRHFDAYLANALHHAQPDSWERIIEDACDMTARCCDDDAGKAELVERCKRLAGEKE